MKNGLAASTVAICDDCWRREEGEREPVRMRSPEEETCYACEGRTKSGIYARRWIARERREHHER